ncbi:MAG TPA: nucleotidyltransferase family protein [Clostridia bacterium]|nr:nucleotidyltransferase family protein [Clostridia bacterium]
MKITGIVSEYNPFHFGHKFHIEQTKKNGADYIIAVMSGNFVQRGECAAFEKHVRAKAALENGVDLVVELPVPYASANAQTFARGAVYILNSLGCVDELSFGSESANIKALTETANAVETPEFKKILSKKLEQGLSFAQARELSVREVLSDKADVLKTPNDTLAVEYIGALNRLKSSIEPFAVKRFGAAHDSKTKTAGYHSASYIREKILKGSMAGELTPSDDLLALEIEKGRAPVQLKALETAILCRLRQMVPLEIAKAPDISEGIENRIYNAVREATTLEELYDFAKTKRYSHARIRRIVLHSFLGITAQDNSLNPFYIRVLGMNNRGKDVLRIAREKATLPIVMRAADVFKLDSFATRAYEIECITTDIFALAMPKPQPCGMEQRENVVLID